MSVCRIAVCDDVDIERDMLCTLLRQYDDRPILYRYSCGEDLLAASVSFDLVFLDIYMNGMTGMETARRLKERDADALIVFLTASSAYAVESYELQAFDYMVKPLQPKRLKTVWDRFISQYQKRPQFYLLNNGKETKKLPYQRIEFLDSDRHYVTVHMADGTEYRVLGRLDDFEKELDAPCFLRCHKSYLINLDLTKAMDEDFLMFSGRRVAYKKRDKKQLQKIFSAYSAK